MIEIYYPEAEYRPMPYGKVPYGVPYGKMPYGVPYGKAPYGKAPYGKMPYGKMPYRDIDIDVYRRPWAAPAYRAPYAMPRPYRWGV